MQAATQQGIAILQVLSDDKHYRPFVCSLCFKILALDAVVTNSCSHAYCFKCLERQAQHETDADRLTCVQCKTRLSTDQSNNNNNHSNTTSVASHELDVRPLKLAQPMAFQCLSWIQVACIGRNDLRRPCMWSGNYIDYPNHAAVCPFCIAAQKGGVTSPSTQLRVRPPPVQRTKSLPSLFVEAQNDPNYKPLRAPSLAGNEEYDDDYDDDDDTSDDINHTKAGGFGVVPRSPGALPLPEQFFRQSASMRDFSRESSSIKDFLPEAPHRTDSPRVEYPTEDTGLPVEHDDTRDLPPHLVQRTISNSTTNSSAANPPLLGASHHSTTSKAKQNKVSSTTTTNSSPRRNTAKPVPEDKRLRKYNRRRSAAAVMQQQQFPDHSYHSGDDLLEAETGDELTDAENWNVSINSLTAWGALNNSSSALKTMSMVEQSPRSSSHKGKAALEGASLLDNNNDNATALLAKAEKLKKQANAKFNKGDFNAARTLYTEGIRCMADIPRMGPKEGEILSNMHSNRAVTYFREKNFVKCLQDCDVAIQYDPYYEKSWIRKWRALMALGQFRKALDCLESGVISLPESSKIKKELLKCKSDMDTVDKAKALLDKREYTQVRDMLKSHIRNAAMDNIAILHLAARADAYMGSMDSSMEKINRALRYNPNQADGLAVRGAILYLAGETEKGLHLLQDAYGRDKENKSIKLELQQCQRTHTSLSKGRNCVKRGRYLEAIEHFSAAMKEKTLVPEKTPLYAMVRCERAESWMLSSKYMEALRDCQDVIHAQQENATAWTVRAEILIALGKADEAQKELNTIRKSWGLDNSTIEEGYRRVDFELRVLKADDELTQFVATLEQGLGKKTHSSKSSSDKNKSSTASESESKRNNRRMSNASSGNDTSDDRFTPLSGSERKSSGNKSDTNPKSSRTKRRERQKSTASVSSADASGSSDLVGDSSVLLSPVSVSQKSTTNAASSSPRKSSKGTAMRKGTSTRRLASEERQTSSRRLSNGNITSKQTSRRHLSEDRQTSSRRLASSGKSGDKQHRSLERKVSDRGFASDKGNERGSVKRV